MRPHVPVMEARRTLGRSNLLEAADSALDQKSTTRISPNLSLRIVSLFSWEIEELEPREAREISMHHLNRMWTNRLVQQPKVPLGQKTSAKPWPPSRKHYSPR